MFDCLLKTLVRLSLVLCIFFYSPLGPLGRPLKHIENSPASLTGGIGGMDYSETDLSVADLSGDAAEQFYAGAEYSAGFPDSGFAEGLPLQDATAMLTYSSYTIQSDDMIGFIAARFGLNQDTLISVNNIANTRAIQIGKRILIPNQDGIMHTVLEGETLASLAEKYEVETSAIIAANELFSDRINAGATVFIPNAKLDDMKLREINGDIFSWPVRGRITSRYGYRVSPITLRRGFHAGLDISANTGVPIRAAMRGRVTSAGYNDVFGNFVIISHNSNYRTLYGHMDVIRTQAGAYVDTGELIGDVGNTGQSTGPHLHFQVYKNGHTVNPALLMR